jgi:hypothetical protein
MEEYKNLSKADLVDLFSQYMQRYTRVKKELGSELELMRCRLAIDILMKEIESRNSTLSFRGDVADPSSDQSRVA